ncbi:MAG TPA: alpha/beta hydrolase [Agriterribacter sp.]|nr:alpha/beta hydrolase [Agriterribacter sp.]
MMVKTVYCICGLGSDERIFSKLRWKDADVHYLHWLMPLEKESLTDYALRMSEKVTEKESTLIGVSFGGIMSIEIAKLTGIQKVVLISSVKTHNEVPLWLRTMGKLSVESLIPQGRFHHIRPLKLFAPVQNYFLGAVTDEEKRLAHEYRKNVDTHYLKWSIHQILNWKNEWLPEKLFHLHGKKDKLFPHRLVNPTHSIEAAGHFLIYQHPQQVSNILNVII